MKKRPDGRYKKYVTIGRDPATGKPIRKAVYGRTIPEVETAAQELRESLKLGIVLDRTTTLAIFAPIWLESSISKSKVKSYAQYEGVINRHIIPRLGAAKLTELKPIQITHVLTDLVERGFARTAVLLRMTLIQIFDAAIDNDLANRNPAARTKKPKYAPAPKTPLDEAEIQTILSAELDPLDRLYLCLELFQGLRRGEILALKRVSQTDKIRISQVWELQNDGKARIKALPKTAAGFRELALMPQTKAALEAVQADHSRVMLFSNEDGSLLSEAQYDCLWKRITSAWNVAAGGTNPVGRRAGIQAVRDITSHHLRHTFATMLYYAGFDPLQMQYLLGHADIKTTLNTYTHIDKSALGKKNRYSEYRDDLRHVFLGEPDPKLTPKLTHFNG